MPVSCASMVQNRGVLATDLAPPAPNPVTSSQPLARTITGRNSRRPDMNSSTYPPPTSTGHNNAECGIAGSPQTALARLRAAAGSRTVTPRLCLGIGLAWPSWLRDGVRTTRTRVTAAGSAHSSAELDWRVGPWLPADSCVAPRAPARPQPARTAAPITINPAAARDAALFVGFGIVLILVGRPVVPDGSARASDAGGLHAAQFLLELPDLIPEPCSELELKLGRRHVHLVGQR